MRRKWIQQPALDQRNLNVEDRFLLQPWFCEAVFAKFVDWFVKLYMVVELVLTLFSLADSFDSGRVGRERAVLRPSDVSGSGSIIL